MLTNPVARLSQRMRRGASEGGSGWLELGAGFEYLKYVGPEETSFAHPHRAFLDGNTRSEDEEQRSLGCGVLGSKPRFGRAA